MTTGLLYTLLYSCTRYPRRMKISNVIFVCTSVLVHYDTPGYCREFFFLTKWGCLSDVCSTVLISPGLQPFSVSTCKLNHITLPEPGVFSKQKDYLDRAVLPSFCAVQYQLHVPTVGSLDGKLAVGITSGHCPHMWGMRFVFPVSWGLTREEVID